MFLKCHRLVKHNIGSVEINIISTPATNYSVEKCPHSSSRLFESFTLYHTDWKLIFSNRHTLSPALFKVEIQAVNTVQDVGVDVSQTTLKTLRDKKGEA